MVYVLGAWSNVHLFFAGWCIGDGFLHVALLCCFEVIDLKNMIVCVDGLDVVCWLVENNYVSLDFFPPLSY